MTRPPKWLWPLSVVLQVSSAAVITSYTYFFVDDFLFLRQAQTQPFNLTYLREPLFEHFSPVSRVLDKLVVSLDPAGFSLAHAVELGFYAAVLVAFAVLVAEIIGAGWAAFGLTLLFGQSVFLMRLLNWWTATANILPATLGGILMITGYLKWRRVRGRPWLAVAFGGFALALADYEMAMLLPFYLAALGLLVLEDSLTPRAWLATLSRERAAWIGFAALEALALVNFFHRYYFPMTHPPLGRLVHYFEIALVETFVPALFGVRNAQVAVGAHWPVIVAVWIVGLGALALTLYTRPRAWRCLLAFALIFAVTLGPVGLNRVRMFGVGFGAELYYQQSLQVMFFVLACFAVSRRWGTRPLPESLRFVVALSPARLGTRRLLGIAGVAAAIYGGLYVGSVTSMRRHALEPAGSKAYVRSFHASLARFTAATGSRPVLVDLAVPAGLMPAAFVPYNAYGGYLRVVTRHLLIGGVADPSYVLDPSGRLTPVRFVPVTAGVLARAVVAPSSGGPGRPAPGRSRREACLPRTAGLFLSVALRAPQPASRPPGLPFAARISYRSTATGVVGVVFRDRRGASSGVSFPHVWRRGPGAETAAVALASPVVGVGIQLAPGSCVTRVTFGRFVIAGPPV